MVRDALTLSCIWNGDNSRIFQRVGFSLLQFQRGIMTERSQQKAATRGEAFVATARIAAPIPLLLFLTRGGGLL